jgi:hypothetical protein
MRFLGERTCYEVMNIQGNKRVKEKDGSELWGEHEYVLTSAKK